MVIQVEAMIVYTMGKKYIQHCYNLTLWSIALYPSHISTRLMPESGSKCCCKNNVTVGMKNKRCVKVKVHFEIVRVHNHSIFSNYHCGGTYLLTNGMVCPYHGI